MDRKPAEFDLGSSTWRWLGVGLGVELLLPRTGSWFALRHPDVVGPFRSLEEARRGVERLLAR